MQFPERRLGAAAPRPTIRARTRDEINRFDKDARSPGITGSPYHLDSFHNFQVSAFAQGSVTKDG